MFYAHFVLAKKGPLARIWLAAHWDKKLTKAHVFETNIEKSVDGILQPKVKMALRTSGHLLLGVVRIYSRKAKYLLADCNEAFVKIKMAFRPGMVDLPEDNREAAINAITLPEVFHDFDTPMPELNDVDIEAQLTLNQSRAEEITLPEEYVHMSRSIVDAEEGFGDAGLGGFGSSDLLRAGNQSIEQANLLFSEGLEPFEPIKEKEPQPSTSGGSNVGLELDTHMRDDGFGGQIGQDIDINGFENGGLFDDPAVTGDVMPQSSVTSIVDVVPGAVHSSDEMNAEHAVHSDDDGNFDCPPSPMHSSIGDSPPASPAKTLQPDLPEPKTVQPSIPQLEPVIDMPSAPSPSTPVNDQTLLLHNEEETFALRPIDTSAIKGINKAKRKRKLIVDDVKNISGEEMKSQLSDTSDIVTSLDLAPPTKRLMHWKETGGVEKLFALPGRPIPARCMFKLYQRHLTSRVAPNDEVTTDSDPILLEQINDGFQQNEPVAGSVVQPPGKRGRKRKEPTQISALEQSFEENKILDQNQQNFNSELPATAISNDVATPVVPDPPAAEVKTDIAAVTSIAPDIAATPEVTNDIAATPTSVITNVIHSEDQQQLSMQHMDELEARNDDSMANMGYDEDAPPVSAISERGAPTPWGGDDYDFPVSVGPAEEQALDETFEQFEERVLNKRANHMYQLVKGRLEIDNILTFSGLTIRNNKKQVAQKFYSLLMLKKFQVVELLQEHSYDTITITPGINFANPTL